MQDTRSDTSFSTTAAQKFAPVMWVPEAVTAYPGWYKPSESIFWGAAMSRNTVARDPTRYYTCVSNDSPYVSDTEVQVWYQQ